MSQRSHLQNMDRLIDLQVRLVASVRESGVTTHVCHSTPGRQAAHYGEPIRKQPSRAFLGVHGGA